jgi:hypothetical protein
MSRPKNKRLKKTHWHVAVRAAAVQGARTAFPQLSATEIGAALGMTRYQARHYMLGTIKSGFNQQPEWAATFMEGCRAIAAGNLSKAAEKLEHAARRINADLIQK